MRQAMRIFKDSYPRGQSGSVLSMGPQQDPDRKQNLDTDIKPDQRRGDERGGQHVPASGLCGWFLLMNTDNALALCGIQWRWGMV